MLDEPKVELLCLAHHHADASPRNLSPTNPSSPESPTLPQSLTSLPPRHEVQARQTTPSEISRQSHLRLHITSPFRTWRERVLGGDQVCRTEYRDSHTFGIPKKQLSLCSPRFQSGHHESRALAEGMNFFQSISRFTTQQLGRCTISPPSSPSS